MKENTNDKTNKDMEPIRKIFILLAALPMLAAAQDRFGTRTGNISFFSSTPVEDIEANNHKVSCVLDAGTGAIQFAVLIKAFEFEKALMQEHFNENYMESNTFPKAEFKGRVDGFTAANAKTPGRYEVTATGDLTIHGVTKPVTQKGIIEVMKDGALKAESDFVVRPEDYDITIPSVVRKNIAEVITVKVRMTLDSL